MADSVVLDSSLIAALFFKDPHSDLAEEALQEFKTYHTLDLAFAEVGNVAWKRVYLFNEEYNITAQALEKAADFIASICQVAPSRDYLKEAFDVGVKEGLTVYDSLFISQAKRLKTTLLTVDSELHRKAEASKNLRGTVSSPK